MFTHHHHPPGKVYFLALSNQINTVECIQQSQHESLANSYGLARSSCAQLVTAQPQLAFVYSLSSVVIVVAVCCCWCVLCQCCAIGNVAFYCIAIIIGQTNPPTKEKFINKMQLTYNEHSDYSKQPQHDLIYIIMSSQQLSSTLHNLGPVQTFLN